MVKNTTDIWFAAFLRNKGFNMKTVEVIKRGKGKFYFEIDDESWKSMKLDFLKSDFCKCKELISQLKDLTF